MPGSTTRRARTSASMIVAPRSERSRATVDFPLAIFPVRPMRSMGNGVSAGWGWDALQGRNRSDGKSTYDVQSHVTMLSAAIGLRPESVVGWLGQRRLAPLGSRNVQRRSTWRSRIGGAGTVETAATDRWLREKSDRRPVAA